MVLARDDVAVRLRRPGQHRQHLRQTRQGRKASGVQRRRGGESAHVGVGRDDVGVTLVQRRDGAGAAPVDEVRGEELDVGEGDVAGGGDLGEGFGRGGGADVVGQGPGELAGGLVDVFEDAGFVVEEEEGEVAGQVGVFGRGVVGQGGGGCEPEAGEGGFGGGGEDGGRGWDGDLQGEAEGRGEADLSDVGFGDAGVEGGDCFGEAGLGEDLRPESRHGGFYGWALARSRWERRIGKAVLESFAFSFSLRICLDSFHT